MRFRDRKHQLAVQAAEREDPVAQALVAEFCELINFPYQQENNLFAVGYYTALMGPAQSRMGVGEEPETAPAAADGPTPAPEWPAEPIRPFGETNPDLSRLAQEFIRSARPVQEAHPAGTNGDADALKQASLVESHEEVEPAGSEGVPLEQPAEGNGKYDFHIPQYAAAWGEDDEQPADSASSTPIEDSIPSLDELLDLEIGHGVSAAGASTAPEPGTADESESSGIGHVLDASLADDELDIALPAELVDPAELESYSSRSDEPLPLDADALNQPPRRR
jgi:hypothetical protein